MSSRTARPQSDVELKLTRHFNASPETLFDYLTDPAHLPNWFAPSATMKTVVHSLDLRVGGRYRISMIDPAKKDKPHTVAGEYLEIDRPGRLAYTWYWETEPETDVSRVTVTLSVAGDGTRMELVHSQFHSDERRDQHLKGWNGCLDRLEDLAG